MLTMILISTIAWFVFCISVFRSMLLLLSFEVGDVYRLLAQLKDEKLPKRCDREETDHSQFALLTY